MSHYNGFESEKNKDYNFQPIKILLEDYSKRVRSVNTENTK